MKQKIILAAVVLVVVGLFVTGVLNWEKTTAWARRLFYQGRSTVSRATDFSTPQLGDVDAARVCRDNLRRIESAKRKVAENKSMAVGRLTWDEIRGEFPGGKIPTCPSGGSYSIGNLGTMPTCTVSSGRTGRPEDDHVLINY